MTENVVSVETVKQKLLEAILLNIRRCMTKRQTVEAISTAAKAVEQLSMAYLRLSDQ